MTPYLIFLKMLQFIFQILQHYKISHQQKHLFSLCKLLINDECIEEEREMWEDFIVGVGA